MREKVEHVRCSASSLLIAFATCPLPVSSQSIGSGACFHPGRSAIGPEQRWRQRPEGAEAAEAVAVVASDVNA